MDSRHAQTQSYEQWDFMKREIRASRTCSVTQDVAQQAELQSQRLSLERNYAEALTWIAHLAPYVDGGISVLPPHHTVESTRVVPDHENPSYASVVGPKDQSRETIRSITRDPAAWTS